MIYSVKSHTYTYQQFIKYVYTNVQMEKFTEQQGYKLWLRVYHNIKSVLIIIIIYHINNFRMFLVI